MFSKENSRFLTTANVLLLGQVVIGAIYFLFNLAQLVFPAGDFVMKTEEWIRTLTITGMGAVLLMALNKRRKFFGLKLTREEKAFKFVDLAVFDVAASMAISYLLSLLIQQTDLSVRAILHSVVSSTAVAVVFLGMLIVVPRLKLFREEFSKVLNGVILVIVLGLGWDIAWLISTLVEGPDGASDVTQAVFLQQLFRFAITGIVLGVALVLLVRNGAKMSGIETTKQMGRRGQKAVYAMATLENRELKDEIRELKEEVAGLKKQLKKKNQKKQNAKA